MVKFKTIAGAALLATTLLDGASGTASAQITQNDVDQALVRNQLAAEGLIAKLIEFGGEVHQHCHDPFHLRQFDLALQLAVSNYRQSAENFDTKSEAQMRWKQMRAGAYWDYRAHREVVECIPDSVPGKAKLLADIEADWANDPLNPNH